MLHWRNGFIQDTWGWGWNFDINKRDELWLIYYIIIYFTLQRLDGFGIVAYEMELGEGTSFNLLPGKFIVHYKCEKEGTQLIWFNHTADSV